MISTENFVATCDSVIAPHFKSFYTPDAKRILVSDEHLYFRRCLHTLVNYPKKFDLVIMQQMESFQSTILNVSVPM